MGKKKALISGITGQDGAYLAKHLLKLGYEVIGSSRDSLVCDKSKLIKLNILNDINLVSIAPNDFGSVLKIIKTYAPDEIYNLAGLTSVALSYDQPFESIDSIAGSTLNFLEAIRIVSRDIKLFNAGSSECFGNTKNNPANEKTIFSPRSPYAIAKATAYWYILNYRETYDIFCCTGIMGNHESSLRPKRFVTQKIISTAKLIASGKDIKLTLGNLDTWRDWGWSPEYVVAMQKILSSDKPSDFIIATGKSHSLKDFATIAFELCDLDLEKYLCIDNSFLRPNDINYCSLDPSKIAIELGWKANTNLKELIKIMLSGI